MVLGIIIVIILFILFFSWIFWLSKKQDTKEFKDSEKKPISFEDWKKEKEKDKDIEQENGVISYPVAYFQSLLKEFDIRKNSINVEYLKKWIQKEIIKYNKDWNKFYVPKEHRSNYILNKIYGKGIYIIYFDISRLDIKEDIKTIPCYIGQSRNITNRWMWHLRHLQDCQNGLKTELRYNKILWFAKKYHLNINYLRFAIIERCDVEFLNKNEEYFINLFQSDLYGWNYNFRTTEETINKLLKNY